MTCAPPSAQCPTGWPPCVPPVGHPLSSRRVGRGAVIEVAKNVWVHEDELQERSMRASGPGGQHVNKTSTAVELRFDVRNARGVPEDVKTRLVRLAGSRMTKEGVLILVAEASRSQAMNRHDVRTRLFALLRAAAVRPIARRATRPTRGSQLRRLASKTRRSDTKANRSRPTQD